MQRRPSCSQFIQYLYKYRKRAWHAQRTCRYYTWATLYPLGVHSWLAPALVFRAGHGVHRHNEALRRVRVRRHGADMAVPRGIMLRNLLAGMLSAFITADCTVWCFWSWELGCQVSAKDDNNVFALAELESDGLMKLLFTKLFPMLGMCFTNFEPLYVESLFGSNMIIRRRLRAKWLQSSVASLRARPKGCIARSSTCLKWFQHDPLEIPKG